MTSVISVNSSIQDLSGAGAQCAKGTTGLDAQNIGELSRQLTSSNRSAAEAQQALNRQHWLNSVRLQQSQLASEQDEAWNRIARIEGVWGDRLSERRYDPGPHLCAVQIINPDGSKIVKHFCVDDLINFGVPQDQLYDGISSREIAQITGHNIDELELTHH